MKKLIKIFLIVLFLIPITVKADNLTPIVEDKYALVYDYADLLTDEEEKELKTLAENYIDSYSMNMILVTIDENQYGTSGSDTQKYIKDFYDNNKFGDNGIAFIIDMSNRYDYIYTVGNSILYYDDERIDSLLDKASNYLKNEKYKEAFNSFIENASSYASKGIPDSNKGYCVNDKGDLYLCKDIPQVTDKNQKVYDYAELLTDDEEKKLQEIANNYVEKYKMDMVFVTILKNPYGVSDEFTKKYAEDFYDNNNFGVGSTYDGIIFLIDMDNRYPYISTVGNAILYYDDARINAMHNNVDDYLQNDKFFEALKTYGENATTYAESGIPDSNKYYCIDEDGEYYKCKTEPKSVNWGITVISAVVGSLLILFIHTRKYKGVRLATNANEYLKNYEINNSVDRFLTTFTSKVKRSHDSGSGGVGGSSVGHGSSGRTHGGGGGHHF